MEDFENKMGDCSFKNDIFNDIDIMPTVPNEQQCFICPNFGVHFSPCHK